ncbi:MAG: zinc ribbon domain-containing protein [Bacteroidales bacterium]|nr:zinc ribbon domain-containing protein [Bacteroidales bacterium]
MSKLEALISKWKFKKIAITYIIVALIAAIGCATAAGIVYKERISFAWQYARVSESAEKSNASNLTAEIDKLAASSDDVIDILVLDSSNNVTYSAKNSEFGTGQFNLTRAGEDKNYLVSDTNDSVAFKYVKGEEFMLASVFNRNFGDIRDEYDEESFFETGYSNKTVYMLSFLGEKDSGNKIYIISDPTTVTGGALTLKIVTSAAMLLFMVYWVLLALWAFQNASKSKLYPLFWGIIVLLTNIAGVIVYLLYKRGNATCTECGASQSKSHIYCSSCGAKLGETCENCGAYISKRDVYCPNCGKKIQ